MPLSVVILAAGQGKRMNSDLPKVLQPLAGRPLLSHVLDTARQLGADATYVVYGHGGERVRDGFSDPAVQWVLQAEQHGTGHALAQAMPQIDDAHHVLVLYGDVPLVQPDTLRPLIDACSERSIGVLSVVLDDPTGYGRIVRDGAGTVARIVEHKDANAKERALREVNTGLMCLPAQRLRGWLAALRNDNAQQEYYLTDVVAMAVADGVPVVTAQPASEIEVLGVNSPVQLAELERRYQRRLAETLMEAGVRLADPARFDLRGVLSCAEDVEIDVGCVFEGTVSLGANVRVGAHCVIRNATIAANAVIHPFTHIEGDAGSGQVAVGSGSLIGPFARLRPGAQLGEEVHIGNFVEVKNSTLARGAKANHLAYLGDATVGERVNYGAGSITANYDGANKHRTVIGNDVHVGSNCVLVAPITVGDGATIGGGSTISKDAPAGQLTVARGRQVSIAGWKRPVKAK